MNIRHQFLLMKAKTLEKYEQLWRKIKDLIRSTSTKLENYDEKYMKIRFNSDDGLPLKRILELCNRILIMLISSPYQGNQQVVNNNKFISKSKSFAIFSTNKYIYIKEHQTYYQDKNDLLSYYT